MSLLTAKALSLQMMYAIFHSVYPLRLTNES